MHLAGYFITIQAGWVSRVQKQRQLAAIKQEAEGEKAELAGETAGYVIWQGALTGS